MESGIRSVLASLALIAALGLAGCSTTKPPPADVSFITSGGQMTQVRYEPFAPYPQAASVRLFVDPGEAKRKAGASLEPAGGHLLTPAQKTYFEGSIRPYAVIGPDRRRPPSCFVPHHFFRYFDAGGRQLGEVAVCLCCSGVSVEPAAGYVGPGRGIKFERGRLEMLVTSLGYATDIDCGFRPG